MRKQILSGQPIKIFVIVWMSLALKHVSAQTPAIYHPGDIAVINSIIENNGLEWTKADPADGSFIPDDWTGFSLSENNSNYAADIIFGNGTTFDNVAISYENGILTSTSDAAVIFNFISPVGLTGESLSGTITLTYEINPGNDNLPTNSLKAYVQNGMLHVSGLTAGKPWSVYNLSGALIYHHTASGHEENVSLSDYGIYIVKTDTQTAKIMYK